MGDRSSSRKSGMPVPEATKKPGASLESEGGIEESELRKVTGGASSDSNPTESVSLNFGHIKSN